MSGQNASEVKNIPSTWKSLTLSFLDRFSLPGFVLYKIRNAVCCGKSMMLGKTSDFHTAEHFDMLCSVCHRVQTILYTDKWKEKKQDVVQHRSINWILADPAVCRTSLCSIPVVSVCEKGLLLEVPSSVCVPRVQSRRHSGVRLPELRSGLRSFRKGTAVFSQYAGTSYIHVASLREASRF